MKRYTQDDLFEILGGWNDILRSKITIVACGGTALTLQNIKSSTKDIDLIIPITKEYSRLIKHLKAASYRGSGASWNGPGGLEFDLFVENRVHTTELLDPPLDPATNTCAKEWKNVSLLILNDHDLIISKMFRGSPVDLEDCSALIQARGNEFNWDAFLKRYHKTSMYDVNPERMQKNLSALFNVISKQGINVVSAMQQYEEWFT